MAELKNQLAERDTLLTQTRQHAAETERQLCDENASLQRRRTLWCGLVWFGFFVCRVFLPAFDDGRWRYLQCDKLSHLLAHSCVLVRAVDAMDAQDDRVIALEARCHILRQENDSLVTQLARFELAYVHRHMMTIQHPHIYLQTWFG